MRFPPAMISLSYGYFLFFLFQLKIEGCCANDGHTCRPPSGSNGFHRPNVVGFVRVSVRSFIARSWAFHLIYASRGRSINTIFFLPGRKRETNGFCFIVPTDVLRTWTAPPGIAISLEYITFDYRRSSADAQTMGFVTQNSVECGIEPLATIFPRGATENKIRKRRRRRRGLNGTRQTFTTVVFRVMGEYIVK